MSHVRATQSGRDSQVMTNLVSESEHQQTRFNNNCFSLEQKLRRRKRSARLLDLLVCGLYSLIACSSFAPSVRCQHRFHNFFGQPAPVFSQHVSPARQWSANGPFLAPTVHMTNQHRQHHNQHIPRPQPQMAVLPTATAHRQRQLFARNLNFANDNRQSAHNQVRLAHHSDGLNLSLNRQFPAERRNSFNGPTVSQQQHQPNRPEERNTQQQQQAGQQNPNGRLLICYYTTRQSAPFWPKDTRESFVVPENHILGKSNSLGAIPSMARFIASTVVDNTTASGGGKNNSVMQAQQQQASFSPVINYEPFVRPDRQRELADASQDSKLLAPPVDKPQVELQFSSASSVASDQLPYSKSQYKQSAAPQFAGKQHLKSAAGGAEQARKSYATDSELNDNLVATNLIGDNNQNAGFVPTVLPPAKNQFASANNGVKAKDERDELDQIKRQQAQRHHLQSRPAKLQMVAIALPAAADSKAAHSSHHHQKAAFNPNNIGDSSDNSKSYFNKNNRVDHQHDGKLDIYFQAPPPSSSGVKHHHHHHHQPQTVFSPSMSRAFMAGGATAPRATVVSEQPETKSSSSSSLSQLGNATAAGGPHVQFQRHPAVSSFATATTPLVPSLSPALANPSTFSSQRAKSLQTAESELTPSLPLLSPTTLIPTTGASSMKLLSPMMVGKSSPAALVTLPSTSYAYRNLQQQQQNQSPSTSLIDDNQGGSGPSTAAAGLPSLQTTDSVLVVDSNNHQRNTIRFAQPSTSQLVRFPSSSDPSDNKMDATTSDQLRLSSVPAAATSAASSATTAAVAQMTNNNHANNRQHNQPIQSPTSQLVSSALVSSPLSTMFDVFGAASHYLMRFKPSSLISPSSSLAAFNTLASHEHHQVGDNSVQHGGKNSTAGGLSLTNSLISLNPFSGGLLSGAGKLAAGQSSNMDRMSSGSNSIASSNNFMSRLNLQTNQRREDICGRTIQTPERRIIGGEGARYGEFPYQVHIKIAKHQCGGALVDKQSIVTAAHCVYHFITRAPVSKLQIVIGAYDIEDEQYQELPPQYFKVNKVKLHPNFRFSASHPDRYDIAILKLDKPVKYTDNVLPVCLPSSKELKFESQVGTVTGFGKTDPSLSNRYGTRLLQKVDVPIIENNECERWHRTRGIDLKIFPEMMCAGYEDGLKDACVGDSGGPLVVKTAVNNSNGSFRWTLAGITSAGFGCAQSRQPGIYHRVSHTVDWILENLD